ncbi:MAG: nucleoside deaminase [Clostridium sp.]|jgi:tRNA(adenine34) deaminase|uniref:nucleoside deaminase n=1 Tax=Clostridium sp. TaxID=1506 RepID=UPI0025C48211|nr:nucleoside deaminase [Clostridium sp.]MCH3965441.1 nucleoside deaminase [Clostridium sp.]MCI1717278.1 nucleoside deaminase [Clostridium sp.]MCI1801618.1 nucleoside deaminase [Clostridium sp.]MCI1815464.1 nucleoside deaminase [Clostridium sp.]MCI1872367.1 nucleoside deaminase [Clostridium sp.]
MDFMQEAIREANCAFKLGEVPVGAVIVRDNKIISRAHNLKETLKDVTCHAEILAIKAASKRIGNWRLSGCTMYVTLEPCPMCAGAIVQCRINKLYIGTFNPTCGSCGSILNLVQNDSINSFVDVKWVYSECCSEILEKFFKSKRIK